MENASDSLLRLEFAAVEDDLFVIVDAAVSAVVVDIVLEDLVVTTIGFTLDIL